MDHPQHLSAAKEAALLRSLVGFRRDLSSQKTKLKIAERRTELGVKVLEVRTSVGQGKKGSPFFLYFQDPLER